MRLLMPCSIGLAIAGCGNMVADSDPAQLVGTDGQPFVVEDLEAIAYEPELDDEAKPLAFRDLGVDDDKLMYALLGL